MNMETGALLDQQIFLLEDVFFEDLIAQAVDAPDDEAAQMALRTYVQEAIDTGDLERSMIMSMLLGAIACLHPHLETAASLLSARQNDFEMRDRKLQYSTKHKKTGDSDTSAAFGAAKKKSVLRSPAAAFGDLIIRYFRKSIKKQPGGTLAS